MVANMYTVQKGQQQYLYFPLPVVGLTGLKSGQGEPVLEHKDCGNVSLVVNDYTRISQRRLQTTVNDCNILHD